MEAESRKILIEGAKAFDIELDDKAVEAFDLYLKELLKWNRKINLTAIRTEKGVVLKHFLDSLSILPLLPKPSSLLDVGSGPGFPGIPLKIVAPSLDVTLIDSVRKKVDFQRHVIRTLGLKGIETIHARIESERGLPGMEGQFDGVISRALSDTQTFLNLSHPFLKRGGVALAMKGKVEERETQILQEAEKGRYRFQRVVNFVLPFSTFRRSVLLFEKK
jgi:16S rRNA (guanine527-N7)-methyltransferase